MERTIALLCLALGLTAAAPPASAMVLYKGVMGIEKASAACDVAPQAKPGTLFTTVYKPAGLGDNGSSAVVTISSFSFGVEREFADFVISSFTLANASLTNVFQTAGTAQATSTDLSLDFQQFDSRMRQQMAAAVDGADFLVWRLQIRRFGNVARCTVTFRGILSLQN